MNPRRLSSKYSPAIRKFKSKKKNYKLLLLRADNS